MEKSKIQTGSPTLVIMPFDDPEEEKTWDENALQINNRTREALSRAH